MDPINDIHLDERGLMNDPYQLRLLAMKLANVLLTLTNNPISGMVMGIENAAFLEVILASVHEVCCDNCKSGGTDKHTSHAPITTADTEEADKAMDAFLDAIKRGENIWSTQPQQHEPKQEDQ
jgi:hypothetical protein